MREKAHTTSFWNYVYDLFYDFFQIFFHHASTILFIEWWWWFCTWFHWHVWHYKFQHKLSFLPLIWQESAVVVLTKTTCYWKNVIFIFDLRSWVLGYVLYCATPFHIAIFHAHLYTQMVILTFYTYWDTMSGNDEGKKDESGAFTTYPTFENIHRKPFHFIFCWKNSLLLLLVFWNHDIYYERTQVTFITTQSFKNDDNEDDHDNWWFRLYPHHVCTYMYRYRLGSPI